MAKKKAKSFSGVVKPIASKPAEGTDNAINGEEPQDAPLNSPQPDQLPAYASDTLQLTRGSEETYEVVVFNDEQRKRREDYDRRITTGLETFIDVATALIGLQEEKLYKETHTTFEAYCEEKYGLGRRRAYQLMEAGKAVLSLTAGDNAPLEVAPTLPAHASALADVEPEIRRDVWNAVVDDHQQTGKKITAKSIEKANERLSGKGPKVKAGKSPKKRGDSYSDSDDEFSDEQAAITSSALTRGLGDYKAEKDTALDDEKESEQDVKSDGNPSEDDTDGAALDLSSFSRSNEPDDTDLNEDYTIDLGDESENQQAEKVSVIREAIQKSVGHEITLLVSGAFLLRTGLSSTWASVRGITDVDSIDEHFEDIINYQQAQNLGII